MSTLFAADWVVPVSSPPLPGGAVLVEGERIAAVGPAARLVRAHPEAVLVELPGCVLAPGFVNLHAHIEYAAYSGLGDGLAFGPWISAHTRRTAVLGPPGLDAMARLGAAECLRSGVTTLVDAAYDGAAVRACSAMGLRAIVAIEAFGGDDADVAAVANDLDGGSTRWRPRPARTWSWPSRRTLRSPSARRSSPRSSGAPASAGCASSRTSVNRATSWTR